MRERISPLVFPRVVVLVSVGRILQRFVQQDSFVYAFSRAGLHTESLENFAETSQCQNTEPEAKSGSFRLNQAESG